MVTINSIYHGSDVGYYTNKYGSILQNNSTYHNTSSKTTSQSNNAQSNQSDNCHIEGIIYYSTLH